MGFMQPNQEVQTILCFIDWLGLSVRLMSEPTPIEGYVWRVYSHTNVWKRRQVLYTDDGDRVLTLLYEPISKLIHSRAGLVEIDNEWLYHGMGPDGILQMLLRSCMFQVTGISRIDLCADFCPDRKQSDIIEGLAAGRYYVQGKRNGSGFWSTNENPRLRIGEAERVPRLNDYWLSRRIPHCQSWGHKTSEVKWKLYYKTKELVDDGGGVFMAKPYIVDHWRMSGMDISNVWRLEVSMKHLNNFQLYGNIFDLDTLRERREDAFLSMYRQRFVIRANEGHKDKSNNSVVDFLPVKHIWGGIRQSPAKSMAEHHGRITLLRHLVKSLEDEHILLDDITRAGVLEHIQKIVKRDCLFSYFQVMTGRFLSEFIEDIENEVVKLRQGDAIALSMTEKGPSADRRTLKPNVDFDDSEPVVYERDHFKEQMDAFVAKLRSSDIKPDNQLSLLP